MLRKTLTACLLSLACALVGGPEPWRAWESAHDRDHPMTGRIIDVAAGREIPPRLLVERLAAARFVLLGEKHDNPDHHRLQAWVIEQLARGGQRRAVAFEMLPLDVAGALAAQRSSRPDDVDAIAAAVGWADGGWPAWALYRPIFAAAVAADAPILAGDLARPELQRLRAGAAPPAALRHLGLDHPLDPEKARALRADLERAHCGVLPENAADRLIEIQRTRDAQLAAALVDGAARDGAILIAGAGHVGREWGVPTYLGRAAPADPAVSLALLEVDPEARRPDGYLDPPPPYDYLWLTPRVDLSDPCERFREQLRRIPRVAPQ
jgi:uncharacterized iron-regulated protein